MNDNMPTNQILDELDKFLQTHKLLKWIQEEIENLNRLPSMKQNQ